MVYLFSYANPLLLLFSTVFVAIHGYRRNYIDENGLLGYRLEDNRNANDKKDPGKNLVWNDPRLGRRKRSEDESTALPENRPNNGPPVVEFLQDTPWAFVALKGGKRRTVNFIPRLGRDSEEEFDSSMNSAYAKSTSRSENQLAVPFGGGNNFTPRLGRYAPLFNRERYDFIF